MDNRLEFTAMAIFLLGCLCDHLTTAYGLTLQGMTELNSNVLLLVRYDVWHFFELLVIATGIGLGFLAVRSKLGEITKLSMMVLLSGGIIRFYAGLHNLTIILNTLS